MITWNDALYARIITGSIPRVIFSGDTVERPEPPFVVIKPFFSAGRKLIQIYVYNIMGTQDMIESYLLRELPELLREPLVSPSGKRTRIRAPGSLSGPHTIADNAISMSRDFWIPLVL